MSADFPDIETAAQAWELWSSQRWAKLEKLINTLKINGGYPPNNGFIDVEVVTLKTNKIIYRYGGFVDVTGNFLDSGRYAADAGTPFTSRAIKNKGIYSKYRVIKDIEDVKKGKAIP